jgi:hypothetical protein
MNHLILPYPRAKTFGLTLLGRIRGVQALRRSLAGSMEKVGVCKLRGLDTPILHISSGDLHINGG